MTHNYLKKKRKDFSKETFPYEISPYGDVVFGLYLREI